MVETIKRSFKSKSVFGHIGSPICSYVIYFLSLQRLLYRRLLWYRKLRSEALLKGQGHENIMLGSFMVLYA